MSNAKKPDILSEKLKKRRTFPHVFQVFGFFFFFLFCLDFESFAKIKKDLDSTCSQKPGLSITQELNKIKKNLKHQFVEIG